MHLAPDLFPLKRYTQFEDALNRTTADPLTSILAALGAGGTRVEAAVEIHVRPASPRRVRRARRCLERLATPFFRRHERVAHWYVSWALSHRLVLRLLAWLLSRLVRPDHRPRSGDALTTSPSRQHEREGDLQAAADKLGRLLFQVRLRLTAHGPLAARDEVFARLRLIAAAFGQFGAPRLARFQGGRTRSQRLGRFGRRVGLRRSFLLSAEELATLWHPPTTTVRAPTMARLQAREFEPPVVLPSPRTHTHVAVLGETLFRGRNRRFGLLPDDRLRHVAVVGKTGMGKSTLLHRLIASDVAAGRGVGLIDPHGDLAEAALACVPARRTDEVVLFDAGDAAHPLAFNPLHCPDPARRPLLASGVVTAFRKLYADSWGPRLEHVLRNAVLALLETPGSTLVSLVRLLSDTRFRAAVVARLGDPVVRGFWEREFARMPPRLQAEAVAPVQNKVGAFVSSPLLRNIVGQPRNRLDLRRVLDDGKVLLVNLSKGRVGDDASGLLGALLVTSLQLAAMERAGLPEGERKPFFLYVDEFQNFATKSFATMLSEARKHGLAVTLANQYLDQLDEDTAAAVFGNVGALVSFQVGAADAEILAGQLAGGVTAEDLLRLPRYQAYARLLVDGQPTRPFSMRTLPPPAGRHGSRVDTIRRYSRQRYCRPEGQVRRALERELRRQGGGDE